MTTQELDSAINATTEAGQDIEFLTGLQSTDGDIIAWDNHNLCVRIGVYVDRLTQAVIDAVTAQVLNANMDDYGNAPLGGLVLFPPQDVPELDFGDLVSVYCVVVVDGMLRGISGAVYP